MPCICDYEVSWTKCCKTWLKLVLSIAGAVSLRQYAKSASGVLPTNFSNSSSYWGLHEGVLEFFCSSTESEIYICCTFRNYRYTYQIGFGSAREVVFLELMAVLCLVANYISYVLNFLNKVIWQLICNSSLDTDFDSSPLLCWYF